MTNYFNNYSSQEENNSLYHFINKLVTFPHLKSHPNSQFLITNFHTTTTEVETTFNFHLIPTTSPNQSPYQVTGNLIISNNIQNYLFKITSPVIENSLIYLIQTTKINDQLSLTETSNLNISKHQTLPRDIYLTIKNYESLPEKIIIPPDSELYRMYKKHQIDLITLSSLALHQRLSYPIYENSDYKTRRLDKKYT